MTSYRLSGLHASPEALQVTQTRAAWPVSWMPIKAAGGTANWILGHGVPLAVDGGHFWTGSGPQARVLRYRFFTDDVHMLVGLSLTMSFASDASFIVTVMGVENLVGPTAAPTTMNQAIANFTGLGEGTMDIDILWDSGGAPLMVHSLALFECPQTILETSGTVPPEPGQPIYNGYALHESIAGLERVTEELRTTYYRRGTVYSWASGTAVGVNTASTSYQPLHPGEAKPAIQNRKMYAGETTRNVKCNVFAHVTGGTGNVRITMTSGASITFNVSNYLSDWQTTQNLAIEVDDPSRWDTDGGIRGGTRDEITIEYRASAGETIYLYAVSIWDAPG